MAIKPLKLKRYISEGEAAQLFSLLIGEQVSDGEMAEYALSGVVPAYMQAIRSAHEIYPDRGFCLVAQEKFDDHLYEPHASDAHGWLSVIPYPLPEDGWVIDSRGQEWRVLTLRDNGALVSVKAEDYVRVYVSKEVFQVAQIVNDSSACPEWPALTHSYGQALVYGDEANDLARIDSPFEGDIDLMDMAERCDRMELRIRKAERRIEWPLVVAGLWELLRDDWKKQGAAAEEIGKRKWKGARKDDVNHALGQAKQAMEALSQ